MIPTPVLLVLGKVTLALCAGLVAVHLARRSTAAVRHLLLAATFAVVIALPFASVLIPAVDIALPVNAPMPTMPAEVAVTEAASPSLADTGLPVSKRANPSAAPFAELTPWFIVASIWLAGTTGLLLPVGIGLLQMRRLRRSGLPWAQGQSVADAVAAEVGIRKHVHVLLHEATPGPITFGVFRPAIVLPSDAKSWNDADTGRAIVHELDHVRRRDWISQRLAHLVCACYWFHPLAWMAWRRFVVEAERACDDAVLRRSEPTAYADQLVTLATHLSASRQPLLTMANRADLPTRVAAVLDRNQPRGRAGRAWLISSIAAAVVGLAIISPLRLVGMTQSQQGAGTDSKKPRYDVASIKPCRAEETPTGARGTYGGTNARYSPGRFYVPCVTAGQLIYLAYAAAGVAENDRLINDNAGAAASPLKVRGGPDWVHSLKDKYEVEATAEGATERTVLMGAMLRTLLEERFKLKVHRETEMVDMLELKLAKGGLRMTPMKKGDCKADPQDGSRPNPADFAATPRCGNLMMMNEDGHVRWTFGGMPLAALAGRLSSELKVFVIDGTDVKDQFVFRFEFQNDQLPAATNPPAPSLNAALEALGLRLEKVKAPRGYLVIDQIERPSPNDPVSIAPARAVGPGVR